MSEAENIKSPTEVYATEPLRETGTPYEPEPIHAQPPPAPLRPASPALAPYAAELCPKCLAILHPKYWHSPPAAAEMVQHFNEWQTAYINTALDILSEMTGDRNYRENRAFGLACLAQMFIMSEPASGIRNAWQVRPSRIERGTTSRRDDPTLDTVEIIEPVNAANPVESVAPEPPEPVPERAADLMYDGTGDDADLYPDRSGDGADLYPKADEE